jgi:nucleotide-binding universal stress UspA family protein
MKEGLSRILVPVSGQPADQEALELACGLAREFKSKLDIVYVIEVKRSLPLDAELEPEIQKAETILEHAENAADREECQVETDLLQARELGPAIVDEAVQRESDLILMGIEHKKRFGEFALGSGVSYILKNAPCRVLVLRRPPT